MHCLNDVDIFDIALPVPDQSADIQFIVDDAGAAP
jgi:hypothetical protein